MSSPVFGREPSRPLPRDRDDSDPTLEIDLTDTESTEPDGRENDKSAATERGEDRDEPGSGAAAREEAMAEGAPLGEGGRGPDGARERNGARAGEPNQSGEADEPNESGEADRLGESGEPDQSGEPDHGERVDEVAGLDVAELVRAPSGESEASATRFDTADLEDDEPEVEPVVLDAEGVSAEPALGHPEPVMPGPVPVEMASGGGNGFEGPWAELQLKFVDDPQSATAGALQLLREALGGLSPEGASTEELRVAFRRYRAAYHDLARN